MTKPADSGQIAKAREQIQEFWNEWIKGADGGESLFLLTDPSRTLFSFAAAFAESERQAVLAQFFAAAPDQEPLRKLVTDKEPNGYPLWFNRAVYECRVCDSEDLCNKHLEMAERDFAGCEQEIEIFLASASQTPRPIIANVNVDAFLAAIGIDTSNGDGLGLEWEPRYIATKAFELATPASTARTINTHKLAHEILRHRIIILECENGVKPCGEYDGEPIYNMGEMIGAETIAINQLQDVIDGWLKRQPASTARDGWVSVEKLPTPLLTEYQGRFSKILELFDNANNYLLGFYDFKDGEWWIHQGYRDEAKLLPQYKITYWREIGPPPTKDIP